MILMMLLVILPMMLIHLVTLLLMMTVLKTVPPLGMLKLTIVGLKFLVTHIILENSLARECLR